MRPSLESADRVRSRRTAHLALRSVLTASLLVAALATMSSADEPVVFPAGSLSDVLAARVGKPVTIALRSGTVYTGTVGEVRADGLVLRQLAGKEFFDAWVALDAIVSIEIRRG